MKRSLQPHYSGDNSHQFWRQVNALDFEAGDQPSLYMAGVILQNLEEYVLHQLNIRIPTSRRKPKRSKP
jgi:hypothetical protein